MDTTPGASDSATPSTLRGGRVGTRLIAAGAVLTFVLAVVAVGVKADDDHGERSTATHPTTTTTTRAVEAVPSTGPTVPATSPSSVTTTSSAVTPRRPATATTMTCRDSGDPRCGPFSYDPPLPPNRSPTISIRVEPLLPKAGEKVTFTVTMDDPDGRPFNWCPTFTADADGVDPVGSPSRAQQRPPCVMVAAAPRYGPWDPPAAFHAVLTFESTYRSDGLHTAEFDTDEFGACDRGACPPVTYRLGVTVG